VEFVGQAEVHQVGTKKRMDLIVKVMFVPANIALALVLEPQISPPALTVVQLIHSVHLIIPHLKMIVEGVREIVGMVTEEIAVGCVVIQIKVSLVIKMWMIVEFALVEMLKRD